MNTDEMKLITDLAEQLKTMDNTKDAEADIAIQQHIALAPEALYKLVQIVLIQHMAIDQLKSKMADLETKIAAKSIQTPTPPKGFLDDLKDKLFGTSSSSTSSQLTASNINNNTQRPAEVSSPNAAAINSGSSFLRQAMTVGAGVAGGMMLSNAIGSLFQHNNASSFATQPTETIENNYYSQDPSTDPAASQTALDNNQYQDDANNLDLDQNFDDSNSFDDSSSDGGDWS